MDSFISFSIASERNKLSITSLFVFYSTPTKAQHCTWTENHEHTANVVDGAVVDIDDLKKFFKIIDVSNRSSDFEGIADKLKATLAVLQGQQPRHSNSTATRIYLPKGTAKEQGHGKTSYKVWV